MTERNSSVSKHSSQPDAAHQAGPVSSGPVGNLLAAGPEAAALDAAAKSILRDKDVMAYILRGCIAELRPYSMECVRDYFMDPDTRTDLPVHADERYAIETIRRMRSLDRESKDPIEGATYYDLLCKTGLPEDGMPDTEADLVTASLDPGVPLPYEGVGGGISRDEMPAHRSFAPSQLLIADSEMQVRFRYERLRSCRDTYYRARVVSEERGVDFTDSNYQNMLGVASIWIYPRPPESYAARIAEWPLRHEVMTTQERNESRSLIAGMARPERSIDVYLGSTEGHVTGPRAAIEMMRLLLLLFTDTGKTQQEIRGILADTYRIRDAEGLAERSINMSNLALQYYEQGADEERAKMEAEFSRLKEEVKISNQEAETSKQETEALKQEAETLRQEVKRLKAQLAVSEHKA
ncbi:MAG: hypothetical protein HDQ87_10200 [Clostridia bacterium]|nr:hypothetical protein [Clostridia bacterium]